MDAREQRRIIEALILASGEPLTPARLAQIVPGATTATVKDRVNELNTEYVEQDRAFEIWEVAGGYQIRTRAEFSGYLQQLRRERPLRLSNAALETLSIIAYKQPVTRGELEDVRGVDSGAVLKSLLERRLVRILGHREVPGRPLLYGTSKRFLEVFGLESIKKLPSLRELEELAQEQGVQLPGMGEDSEGKPDESALLSDAPDQPEIFEADVDGDVPAAAEASDEAETTADEAAGAEEAEEDAAPEDETSR